MRNSQSPERKYPRFARFASVMLVGLCLLVPTTRAQFLGYEATALASLSAFGDRVVGTGMNNHSEIVGYVMNSGNIGVKSFYYSGGTFTDLGHLQDTLPTRALAINDSRQITGYATAANFALQNVPSAFIYANGVMTNLNIANHSRGNAINNHGVIAGLARLGSSNPEQGLIIEPNPLTYSPAGALDPNVNSQLLAINDSGQAVGYSQTYSNVAHAVLFSGGVLTDLGAPGGIASEAIRINNGGTILVRNMVTTNTPRRGFLFSDDAMTDIGSLGGDYANPSDLNNLGVVVGTSETADGAFRSFVYSTDEGMLDLESLFANNSLLEQGFTAGSFRPFAINDHNVIAGLGLFTGDFGEEHRIVLLTPTAIPEPETYGLMLFGVAAMLVARFYRQRRR